MVRYGSYSITISSLHQNFYGSEHNLYTRIRDIMTMKPEYIMCFIAFLHRKYKKQKRCNFSAKYANLNAVILHSSSF